MSKILANQIANYGDNAPIEIKEGLNIPVGKPIQAAGSSGNNGQVLTSTGSSISWSTPFDGNYNSLSNKPVIPGAQVNSDWNAVGTIAAILNKPIIPPSPSVTIGINSNPSSLTYNSVNGEFTYTPPDLSSFATSTDLSTAVGNSLNWDTAYGWGNHASAGYLTTALQNLSDDTNPHLGGNLNLNGNNITGTGNISCTGFSSTANSIILGSASSQYIIQFSQNTGIGPQIRNVTSNNGIGIWGAYNFGSTHSQDVHLGTSGTPSWFKNVEPATDSTYDLGTSSKRWANFYVDNLYVGGTTDIAVSDLDDVDITGGLSDQQVLKWDAASSSWKPANDLVGGAQGIQLGDLSVSIASSGTASLSYNNTNGVFTFTPPNLSSLPNVTTISGGSGAGRLQVQNAGSFAINLDATDGISTNNGIGLNIGNYGTNLWKTRIDGNTGNISTQGNISLGFDGSVYNGNVYAGSLTIFASYPGIGVTISSAGKYRARVDDIGGTEQDALVIGRFQNLDSFVVKSGGNLTTIGTLTASGGNSGNWNTAYGWGNHANAGYLVATSTDKTNWDTAYGWGDHSSAGYLTSYIETDPVFSASIAAGITGSEVANWNTSYGWGDHSSAGYLTGLGSIDAHTDVTITTPTIGQILSYNGSQWVNTTTSPIANATISDTAPGSPSSGDLWWESDKGRLKIYYNDTDSQQWVDASPPLQQDRIASTGAPATATSTGTAGEIRYDSGYVYICVATNTWKRAALATW